MFTSLSSRDPRLAGHVAPECEPLTVMHGKHYVPRLLHPFPERWITQARVPRIPLRVKDGTKNPREVQ